MARLWSSIEKYFGIICIFSATVAMCLLPCNVLSAEEYKAWTGEFMRMGAGARAMGMGNAYTAIDGDIYSSYFNPAGLASMTRREMALSFRYLSMDRYFQYLVFGSRIGPDADFAISWIHSGTDDIDGRDLNGIPTGPLEDKRNAFTVTFSKYLNRWVSAGINTKLAFWKLGGDDAKAFGFDIGVLARPWRNLSASFVIRDINSRFTWKSKRWNKSISGADGQPLEKEDKFPVYYTGGVAYRIFDEKLVISTTVECVEDNSPGLNFGVSYVYNEWFTLRTGLYNYTTSDELGSGSLTAGFTVNASESLSIDYAFVADTIEDDSIHSISLVFNYGE